MIFHRRDHQPSTHSKLMFCSCMTSCTAQPDISDAITSGKQLSQREAFPLRNFHQSDNVITRVGPDKMHMPNHHETPLKKTHNYRYVISCLSTKGLIDVGDAMNDLPHS